MEEREKGMKKIKRGIWVYKSGRKKRRKVVETTGGETAARRNIQYVEREREDRGIPFTVTLFNGTASIVSISKGVLSPEQCRRPFFVFKLHSALVTSSRV
jgi:hypothetical protein